MMTTTTTTLTPIDVAFQKVFREILKRAPAKSYQGKHWAWPGLDRGEWSPKSLLILYHESGLPEQAYHPEMGPLWQKLEIELGAIFGFPVYIENINTAVSAVWPV